MELSENVELVELFEVYNKCLTDKQRQVFSLHILNDLSLQEVSEILKISRQAVKFAFDSAVESIKNLEGNIGYSKKIKNLKSNLDKLKNITKDEEIKIEIDKILEEV